MNVRWWRPDGDRHLIGGVTAAMVAEEHDDSLSPNDTGAAGRAAGRQPQKHAAGAPQSDAVTPGGSRVDAAGHPFDEVAAAMAAAVEAESGGRSEAPGQGKSTPPPPSSRPIDIPELQTSRAEGGPELHPIDLLRDVDLNVKIELGRCRMLVDDVLKLGAGAVVELDKLAGDPVDVYVNDRLVARGEVLVLNDNFCVRVSDIVSRDLEALGA